MSNFRRTTARDVDPSKLGVCTATTPVPVLPRYPCSARALTSTGYFLNSYRVVSMSTCVPLILRSSSSLCPLSPRGRQCPLVDRRQDVFPPSFDSLFERSDRSPFQFGLHIFFADFCGLDISPFHLLTGLHSRMATIRFSMSAMVSCHVGFNTIIPANPISDTNCHMLVNRHGVGLVTGFIVHA